ncbi:MAG: hypothetical protein R3B45_15540 [Bdellovibrionota bacterium]
MRHRVVVAFIILSISCGKKDKSNDDENGNGDGDNTNQPGTLAISEINPLAPVYPYDLQAASPTTATGAEVALPGTLVVNLLDQDDQSYVAKVENAIAVVTSDSVDDCIPELVLPTTPMLSCYSKTVTEDGVGGTATSTLIKFGDINPDRIGSEPSDPTAKRVLDDSSGIISAEEEGQPCSAKVAETITAATMASVDHAQQLMASLLCVAKNVAKKEELPGTGEIINLADAANSSWGSDVDVKAASIARLAEDIDGKPSYQSIVSVVRRNSQGDETKLLVDLVNVVDDQSGNYEGRAFIYDQRRSNGVTTPTVLSLQFKKSTTTVDFVVREAGLNFDVEPSKVQDSSTGLLDFSKLAALNGNNASPSLTQFSLNTKTGVGTVASMRSPAISGQEVSNVIAVTTTVSDNKVTGCGLSGHTKSFADENNNIRSNAVTVSGLYCMKNQSLSGGPSYGNDLNDDQWPNYEYVQFQCFERGADGLVITENRLNYAVAEKCGVGDPDFSSHVSLEATSTALEMVELSAALDALTIGSLTPEYGQVFSE